MFYTHYDLANKQSDTAGYTTDWYLDKISNLDPGDKPTTSVDTILAANALNYHTWRTESDKLLQRMGELRHNGNEQRVLGSACMAVKSTAAANLVLKINIRLMSWAMTS